jgi:protein phosphatase
LVIEQHVDLLEIKEFLKGNLDKVRELFSTYEPLVKVSVDKAVIIGDLHGDADTLMRIIMDYPPDRWFYIMLGDYVDRGEHQVETLYLAFKLFLNKRAILLRGNHESPLTNFEYGFYMELLRKFGHYDGDALYDKLREAFSQMPVAAVVNDEYFLVHGGLPIEHVTLEQLGKLPKPDELPSNEVTFQLLWNDPSDYVKDYEPNIARGPGTYVFGREVTERFLNENGLRLIIRGHEYVPEGFKWNHGNKVLTIFTSRAGPYEGTRVSIAILNEHSINIVRVYPE